MVERMLKTLVITSKVTFAPDNYDPLIVGLAACPQVAGLLILDNKGLSTISRSIGALAHGAYRLGITLIKNHFSNSQKRREQAYLSRKKPVWTLKRLNSPETLRIIEEYQFDLLLNARTRAFFDTQLLAKPAYGAINIHHGLLPEQRGTMCDLWSLSDSEPSGFSIHRMNAEIDAGDILKVVIVSDGTDRDYIKYLIKSSQAELKTVCETLAKIESSGEIRGSANIKSSNLPKRKDPTRADIRSIKRKELLI
jgi:folate-dependent phosphoribosylglycinamide formyltransferase PurN